MIKKSDIFLFIILTVFGIAVSFWSISSGTSGDKVTITVDGNIYGTYDLMKDREIKIVRDEHINNIIIKDGKVSMSFSSCKNQVCVHTGSISRTNDIIACLPNKVIVKVISTDKSGGDVDVISG